MTLSKEQESDLMKVYDAWWVSYLNGDVETYDSYLDDDFRFVGSTNGEEYLNRKDTTGVGLSLSYDIVKAHDGVLEVTTEDGSGTIFTMKIPF